MEGVLIILWLLLMLAGCVVWAFKYEDFFGPQDELKRGMRLAGGLVLTMTVVALLLIVIMGMLRQQ